MKKINLSVYILILIQIFVIFQNFACGQAYGENVSGQNTTEVTLKRQMVTVPAGITFRGVLMSPVSSSSAYTGQQVLLALYNDFYYDGKNIVPQGTAVNGTVIEVDRAKHGSVNGKLMLRFTQLITPTGENIPISAIVKTDDNTGVLIGGNEIEQAALSQPGRPKHGATITTLTGAGGGLAKSIWDKGDDVEIPVNSPVELILTQPITLNRGNK